MIAAAALAETDEPGQTKASRKRAVSSAMKEVSEFLGNTPTLARTAYVDPRVVEAYERGRTIKVRGSYDTDDARQAALAKRVRALLVVTDGGGPNAAQRKVIVEAYGPAPVPVAICSSSRAARAIVTAISWFYPQPMRSFERSDIPRALQFLGIQGELARTIQEALPTLHAAVAQTHRGKQGRTRGSDGHDHP